MIWHFFTLGGFMMWPLLVCSVLLLAVVLERAWTLGMVGWLFGVELPPRLATWHRRVLPFFEEVPPSLGLLGTVIGVVMSFQLANGRIDAEAVGAGLAVACLTTVFGMSLAIVACVTRYVCEALHREPAADQAK